MKTAPDPELADRLHLLALHLGAAQTFLAVALREAAQPDGSLPVIERFLGAAVGELAALRELLDVTAGGRLPAAG